MCDLTHQYAVAGTGWAHRTPLLSGPLSCFFHTGCSSLSHIPCSYVSFPSLHVEQIWHDNLLHVAAARCSSGATRGEHFISAFIAWGVWKNCLCVCMCACVWVCVLLFLGGVVWISLDNTSTKCQKSKMLCNLYTCVKAPVFVLLMLMTKGRITFYIFTAPIEGNLSSFY